MGNVIQGKFYSGYFTTGSDAGTDLIGSVETILGRSITAKKLTLISPSPIHVDVNNLGVYSGVYADGDGLYKLSLDGFDCMVSSLKVLETSGSNIWLGVIF